MSDREIIEAIIARAKEIMDDEDGKDYIFDFVIDLAGRKIRHDGGWVVIYKEAKVP